MNIKQKLHNLYKKSIKKIIVLMTIIIVELNSLFIPVAFAQDASGSGQQQAPSPTPTSTITNIPIPTPTSVQPISPTPVPTEPASNVGITPTSITIPTITTQPEPTIPTNLNDLLSPTPIPSIMPEDKLLENLNINSSVAVPDLFITPVNQQLSAKIRRPINLQPVEKYSYKAGENILFKLENLDQNNITVSVFDKNGKELNLPIIKENKFNETTINLQSTRSFKPGRYTVKISDETGKIIKQDFVWGILAINTDKSIYLPNETAKLSMTVLDEDGNIVCDAKLTLNIQGEKSKVNTVLSTKDGTIKPNSDCQKHNLTLDPDYESSYKVGNEDKYIMTLSVTTKNGDITITDSFEVKQSTPFDITRETATKINSLKEYPVNLYITANQDFQGAITETVPDNFEIIQSKDSKIKTYDKVETKSIPFANQTDNVLGASISNVRLPFDGTYPISQTFGEIPTSPILLKDNQDKGLAGHDGVDFDMPEGTLIYTVDDGTVELSKDSDYGLTVIINHTWGKSYYGHLSEIKVIKDQKVIKGDLIALSGNTGLTTGPHLHFGIRQNQFDFNNGYFGKIDPLPYLGLDNNGVVLGATTFSIKVLSWNISLKKGEKTILGYNFITSNESPTTYLLGPLSFTKSNQSGQLDPSPIFQDIRPWQITNTRLSKIKESHPGQKLRQVKIRQTNNPSLHFKSDEIPQFELDLKEAKFEKILKSKDEEQKKLVSGKIKHRARSNIELLVDISIDNVNENLSVTPSLSNDFKPGLYQLSIEAQTDNGLVNITQDFTWGVLALNTNKSIYIPGETVKLGMAVLDDYGRTKCLNAQDDFGKAKLWLTIKTPTGETYDLSTENGQIKDSGQCDVHSVTNEADFQTVFTQITSPGTYRMHLEGENHNGKRSIDDIFEVSTNPAFDIERTSLPTRIYPPADYTNTITIKANQDFDGEIEEYVPASFVIKDQNPDFTIIKQSDQNVLKWPVSLKQGETITLTYTFDAPNISPEFYLLGPLSVIASETKQSPSVILGRSETTTPESSNPLFSESRPWQIASDATKSWDGGATGGSPTLWSKAANWNADTLPATTDDLVFDGAAGGATDDNNTWDGSAEATYNSLDYQSGYDGDSVITCPSASCTVTGAFTWATGTGDNLTLTSSLALSVGGNISWTSAGTFTANTSTVTMTGTANLETNNKTLYKLTINGNGTTVTVVNYWPIVSNVLTIGATSDNNTDTLSIGSGLYVFSTSAGTVTLVDNTVGGMDTISGAGTLVIQNSNLGTGGTLSSIVRFDGVSSSSVTVPARTYGSDVELFDDVSITQRNFNTASGTINISGNVNLIADSSNASGDVNFSSFTNGSTVNITGNIDYTGTGAADEVITLGSGTWTVAGSVDLTGGTLVSTNGGTFEMSGTTKNLTSASQSFRDLKISGSVTAQDAVISTRELQVTGTFTLGANNLTVGLTSSTSPGYIKVPSGGTISQSASAKTIIQNGASGTSCIGGNSDNSCTGTVGSITFYDLDIGNASAATVTTINGTTPTVTVSRHLNITTSASLSANGTLNVAGNWTKTGGFTANSSEVVLNGTGTQILSGATTFYKLTASSAGGRTINFPSSTTTTVSNTLTLSGTSCASKLTLAPSTPSTAWTLTAPAGTTVTYISVSYSTSTNAITANYYYDGGNNNANWTFGTVCSDTITGNIYQADESTPDTTTYTVAISVNDAAPQTQETSTGSYSISVTSSSADKVMIYISNHATNANTFTITNGGDLTNIHLFVNKFAVTNSNSGSTTNANICASTTYPPASTPDDKLFSCSGNNITYEDNELHVFGGYAPGANVNTTKLHLKTGGTYTGATETLTISGTGQTTARPFYIDGGTFTPTSNTTTFTGGSTSDLQNTTYSVLYINGAGPFNAMGATTVTGGLTVNTGTLAMGDSDLTLGDVTLADSGSITVNNTATLSQTALGTTLMTGQNPSSDTIIAGASTTVSLGSLMTAAGVGLSISGPITASVITMGASTTLTLNSSASVSLSASGTPLTINSSFSGAAGSTVKYTSGSGVTALSSIAMTGSNAYHHLEIAGTGTFPLGAAADVKGNLTITSGTLDVSATSHALSITGNYSNSGTFNARSGTVTFNDTTGSKTLSGRLNNSITSSAFYKVNFNGSGGGWTIQDPMIVSFTSGDATTSLAVTAGTVTLGDGTGDNLEVDGKFVISSGATFQTLSTLSQGNTITIDINNNTTPANCPNCIVDVSGTMTINKNATLKFNSYTNGASGILSGAEVSSTGYLNIVGSQDDTSTETGTANNAARETYLCANESWTNDLHNNKVIMMTNNLAKGRIYTITDTIAGDSTNCATGTDDSIQRDDNSSATDESPAITDNTGNKKIRTSVSLIGANDEGVGRYIHNLADDDWYLIVDSINNVSGSNDDIWVVANPDSLSTLDTNDDVEISDGVKSGDTFEILDFATVTSKGASNRGYIYSKSQSQTNIQYAEVSQLGDVDTAQCNVPTANKCGIVAATIDGYTAGESFNISHSYLHDDIRYLFGTALENATVDSNYFYNSSSTSNSRPIHIENGSNNTVFSNNRIDGFGAQDVGISIQASASLNVVVANNIIYNTTQRHIEYTDGSTNGLIYNNILYLGSTAFHADLTSKENLVNNYAFHNTGTVFSMYGSNTNRYAGNRIFGSGTAVYPYSTSTNISYSINNTYGYELVNSSYDVNFSDAAASYLAFNDKYSSTTPVNAVTASPGYLASFKHNQTAGSTRIYGEYPIPDANSETPQSEETQKFNYSDKLWEDSFTPHLYSGSGNEDTTDGLVFAFSGGSMAGSENHYVYRLIYTGSNTWNVFRNESAGTPSTATSGSQYTDTTTNAQFTIGGGSPTAYVAGDTYTFVIFQDSNDTSSQKSVTVMQTGDIFTVGTGETIQMLGGSTANQTLLQKDSGATSYAINISGGTINANYYKITGTDASGLNISSGTVTDIGNGTFDDTGGAGAADTYMTVTATILNGFTNKTWTGMVFDESTSTDANIEKNITLSGTPADCNNNWTLESSGNKGGATNGEANDVDSDASCGGNGYLLWTTTSSGPTTDQQMRHGQWFNSGTEQGFTF